MKTLHFRSNYLSLNKLRTIFFYLSSALLLLTGFLKIASAAGTDTFLLTPDPVLGLQYKDFFLFVGVTEVFIAVLLLGRNERLKPICLAFLTTQMLAYRLVLWFSGGREPCKCLGNIANWVPLLPANTQLLLKALLIVMFAGAYSYLLYDLKARAGTIVRDSA